MSVKATFGLDIQFGASSASWTPVTSDVRVNPPLRILYGIKGGGPLDRVAETGTMDFGLDSGPYNSVSASGAYSPDHANVREGFAIGVGVRAKFTFGGSTFYKFNGRLDRVQPEPGRYGGLGVKCQATDWFDEAAKHKVTLIAVQEGKRANDNIATVIGAMPQKPAASTLATGQDVFPYAMDNSRDESTLVLTEIVKNVMSELGYAYPAGDQVSGGHLTFEDRHTRLKTSAISASFSNNMVAMDVERGRGFMYNKIRVTTHPREVDSGSQILYRLAGAPTIPATASIALVGRYTDPNNIGAIRVGGVDMISPASGLDFIGNSASDGIGADLTANLGVSASYGGNSVRYVVQNNGGTDLYLTTLQARGFGVYDKEPARAEAEDLPSIFSYGEQVLELDMPYQSNPWVGDDVSRVLLSTGKTPRSETRTMEFVGNRSAELMENGLRLEPGDRIKVVEDATGISDEFFINGVGIQHTADEETLFQFWLSPAGSTAFWLVGVAGFSELDLTTTLGY